MRRFGFISGIFLYVCLFAFIFPKYIVLADDIKEDVETIEENIIDIEDTETDIDDSGSGDDSFGNDTLTDTYSRISDYSDDVDEDSTDENEVEEMQDKTPFEIVVVFSFGLISGIMLGRLLTGFIK